MNAEDSLAAQALQAAYSGNWSQAVTLNQQILQSHLEDVEALNRLAKAYLELQQIEQAVEIYHQVLKIDHYNGIADKNLKRIAHLSLSPTGYPARHRDCLAINFIEEPGVTKTIQLINTGEPAILATIDAGESVELILRKRQICITTPDHHLHIGKIPPDLSARMITLMRGGNQYQAWIRSIKEQCVVVFIREIYRAMRFQTIPSFPDAGQSSYLAFTDPRLIYPDRPDARSTEEQE